MLPSYIADYWGKADRRDEADPQWHPLAYHCLDVAAVADALLAGSPPRLQWIAALCDAQPEVVHRALVVLIALHDIGKFSRHFQAKTDLGPRSAALPPPPPKVRHDAIGYELLRNKWSGLSQHLSAYLNIGSDHESGLWVAVTGHHGEPAMEACGPWTDGFCSAEQRSVNDFVVGLTSLLPPLTRLPPMKDRARVLSWTLAGLTNLSDWIGSNQEWFQYAKPTLNLEAYWRRAQALASTAIAEAGILPASVPPEVLPARLLPHLKEGLSPLQEMALACPLGKGPVLAVVEDLTGAGKTEAALLIAARLIRERRADGLFFALPTMATANAMYDRLGASYRRLFCDDADASLVLAHGKRALHEGFRDSILEGRGANAPAGAASDKQATWADESASAACTAWIADDRRKAFLAHVGIGTIDQALLGILPSRFQSLRLWGLADRVLVVDEAHSFDAYMSRELETLLEFHAALGGSAVVLSATLSTTARQRLTDAFMRGLGGAVRPIAADAYPLLTVIDREVHASTAVASRPEISRSLAVRRIDTAEQAADHAQAVSERGGAVAWIRNAVDDAIEAMQILEARGLAPILLHARFAMGDRLAIEARVQEALGRSSTPATRRDQKERGLIVVGSQILEQSLDYDVDGMITDLAPVDMIIQRAGRLWRHPWRNTARPVPVEERALMVLSPDPGAVVDKEWYRRLLPRAAAVYPDHGFVWLSARVLESQGSIRTPEGIRELLAAVYDDGPQADIPVALERATFEANGKRRAAHSIAAGNSLDIRLGYGGNHKLWEEVTGTAPTGSGQDPCPAGPQQGA